jgi:hypothetical protein
MQCVHARNARAMRLTRSVNKFRCEEPSCCVGPSFDHDFFYAPASQPQPARCREHAISIMTRTAEASNMRKPLSCSSGVYVCFLSASRRIAGIEMESNVAKTHAHPDGRTWLVECVMEYKLASNKTNSTWTARASEGCVSAQ